MAMLGWTRLRAKKRAAVASRSPPPMASATPAISTVPIPSPPATAPVPHVLAKTEALVSTTTPVAQVKLRVLGTNDDGLEHLAPEASEPEHPEAATTSGVTVATTTTATTTSPSSTTIWHIELRGVSRLVRWVSGKRSSSAVLSPNLKDEEASLQATNVRAPTADDALDSDQPTSSSSATASPSTSRSSSTSSTSSFATSRKLKRRRSTPTSADAAEASADPTLCDDPPAVPTLPPGVIPVLVINDQEEATHPQLHEQASRVAAASLTSPQGPAAATSAGGANSDSSAPRARTDAQARSHLSANSYPSPSSSSTTLPITSLGTSTSNLSLAEDDPSKTTTPRKPRKLSKSRPLSASPRAALPMLSIETALAMSSGLGPTGRSGPAATATMGKSRYVSPILFTTRLYTSRSNLIDHATLSHRYFSFSSSLSSPADALSPSSSSSPSTIWNTALTSSPTTSPFASTSALTSPSSASISTAAAPPPSSFPRSLPSSSSSTPPSPSPSRSNSKQKQKRNKLTKQAPESVYTAPHLTALRPAFLEDLPAIGSGSTSGSSGGGDQTGKKTFLIHDGDGEDVGANDTPGHQDQNQAAPARTLRRQTRDRTHTHSRRASSTLQLSATEQVAFSLLRPSQQLQLEAQARASPSHFQARAQARRRWSSAIADIVDDADFLQELEQGALRDVAVMVGGLEGFGDVAPEDEDDDEDEEDESDNDNASGDDSDDSDEDEEDGELGQPVAVEMAHAKPTSHRRHRSDGAALHIHHHHHHYHNHQHLHLHIRSHSSMARREEDEGTTSMKLHLARKAVMCVREIVRTERSYLGHLRSAVGRKVRFVNYFYRAFFCPAFFGASSLMLSLDCHRPRPRSSFPPFTNTFLPSLQPQKPIARSSNRTRRSGESRPRL
ncbi:hypothetical protein DL93DRAFT_1066867 [Clavulina sp. PMI_390]|nr:hypothetical protein DL93DRAFT_1066867 [Clavulina sp. PMI_390]